MNYTKIILPEFITKETVNEILKGKGFKQGIKSYYYRGRGRRLGELIDSFRMIVWLGVVIGIFFAIAGIINRFIFGIQHYGLLYMGLIMIGSGLLMLVIERAVERFCDRHYLSLMKQLEDSEGDECVPHLSRGIHWLIENGDKDFVCPDIPNPYADSIEKLRKWVDLAEKNPQDKISFNYEYFLDKFGNPQRWYNKDGHFDMLITVFKDDSSVDEILISQIPNTLWGSIGTETRHAKEQNAIDIANLSFTVGENFEKIIRENSRSHYAWCCDGKRYYVA